MLSFSDHKRVGETVKSVYDQMVQASVDICNSYPKKSPQAVKARKVVDALVELKSVMDSAVFDENPNLETSELCSIYYGQSEKRP